VRPSLKERPRSAEQPSRNVALVRICQAWAAVAGRPLGATDGRLAPMLSRVDQMAFEATGLVAVLQIDHRADVYRSRQQRRCIRRENVRNGT